MVIESHYHEDHTLGNDQFDSVYMNPVEMDYTRVMYFAIYECFPKYSMKPLEIGTVIDLGDLTVKVVSLKGHSDKRFTKKMIEAHLYNLSNLTFDPKTKSILF